MAIRAVTLTASQYLFSSSSSFASCSLVSASNSPKFVSLPPPPPKPSNLSRIYRTVRRSRTHGDSFSKTRMSATELEPSLLVKNKASEISNELKGTSIFLVGMNCSIKTDLGKLLADALKYYYFDSDSLVKQAGVDSATSFKERDEKAFRDSETEVLKQLSSMGRLVVCAGDGAVQSSTNLALLRYGISIWVNVPLDMLANEVLKSEFAASVKDTRDSDSFTEVLQELSKQYSELREGYLTADTTVSLQKVAARLGFEDMNSVTPQDMAIEALKEIGRLTRVKEMMEAAARPF